MWFRHFQTKSVTMPITMIQPGVQEGADGGQQAVWIGIYKPRAPHTADSVMERLWTVSKNLERKGLAKVAILRSLSEGQSADWVGIYAVWEIGKLRKPGEAQIMLEKLPKELEMIESRAAEAVMGGWYEGYCGEVCDQKKKNHDEKAAMELKIGDVVHVREITGKEGDEKQSETLEYSCLAILKAYFHKTKGMRACMYHRNVHANTIAGLGLWESFHHAVHDTSGEPYWKALGASLRLTIFQVACISTDLHPHTSTIAP